MRSSATPQFSDYDDSPLRRFKEHNKLFPSERIPPASSDSDSHEVQNSVITMKMMIVIINTAISDGCSTVMLQADGLDGNFQVG